MLLFILCTRPPFTPPSTSLYCQVTSLRHQVKACYNAMRQVTAAQVLSVCPYTSFSSSFVYTSLFLLFNYLLLCFLSLLLPVFPLFSLTYFSFFFSLVSPALFAFSLFFLLFILHFFVSPFPTSTSFLPPPQSPQSPHALSLICLPVMPSFFVSLFFSFYLKHFHVNLPPASSSFFSWFSLPLLFISSFSSPSFFSWPPRFLLFLLSSSSSS